MQNQPFKIAILSRNRKLYSTKRLVESIENRGHKAVVLDHLKCDIVIEKGDPSIIHHGERIRGIDAVVPRIGASVTFYGAAVIRQFRSEERRVGTECRAAMVGG